MAWTSGVFFHSKLLLDNSASFISWRMKDLCQKWKVKLIFLQWCSPRDQGLSLEAPRGQKWKSWSWSWTFGLGLGLGFEEKVLQSFKTFVVILDGSEQGTPWHFVRDNKGSLPFGSHCLRESSALHPHQPQLRGYLTMGAICYNHTDVSKAQLHRLWKLLSLGSNKSGKQTVHGLKYHLEKCHKDIYTL